MNPKTFRDHISHQCGFNKAKQGESSLDRVLRQEGLNKWPSVESQEEYNRRMDEREQDRYEQQEDIGGNFMRDRIEANHERYDQQGSERHPFT